MNKYKYGFTLSEALIALAIVAILSAILLPMINRFKPDNVKIKYLQTYDAITSVAKKLANDKDKFRVIYVNPNDPSDTYNVSNFPFWGRGREFCNGFIDGLNAPQDLTCSPSDDGTNYVSNFISNNGTTWTVTTESTANLNTGIGRFLTTVEVVFNDIDPTRTFTFYIGPDGSTVIADGIGDYYRRTRTSWRISTPRDVNEDFPAPNPTMDIRAANQGKFELGDFIEEVVQRDTSQMVTMSELLNGTTSENNEYSISSIDELVGLRDYVNNSANDTTGMNFILGANIDLSSIPNWTPIGDNNKFKGTFDGNGQVIKNLTIDSTNNSRGLFCATAPGSVIKNVGLKDTNIKGAKSTGGLVGTSNFSTIRNCYVTGDVSATSDNTGGLIGEAKSSTVTYCYTTGTVSGKNKTGGLVGLYNDSARPYESSSISNSYATGTVKGYDYVGGLVGLLHQAAYINNSYATGDVSGGSYVGGLAGQIGDYQTSSTIENSYATGNVSGGGREVGGLAGSIGQGADIRRCYATGTVKGSSNVGGLIGWSYPSTVENSYATGNVTGGEYVGGLGGNFPYTYDCIRKCYATGTVEGSKIVSGFVGQIAVKVYKSASTQKGYLATHMTEEEIKETYTHDSMGFTEANGWKIVDGVPLQSWQK